MLYGFETFNQKNEFFNVISWKEINKYKLKEMYKKEQYAKQEFTRYLFFKAISFQFSTMIDLIEELQKDYLEKNKLLNFREKEIKEINFIKKHMYMFKVLLTNSNIGTNDRELKILQESIKSLDLEMEYLKFIQMFLSGEYITKKEEIMEFNGINFFD